MASPSLISTSCLRQIATIDQLVNALHALVPVLVEQYKMAAIRGDAMEAEKVHAELMRIQGEMMDHIYAGIVLRKEAGLI